MSNVYDAIVLGTGGVGSAAIMQLARRGLNVLGLDRFPGGHDRGSSHGQTRIIRLAYFEHPAYVPLLRQAYKLWQELEQAHGSQLYYPTGLLEVGPADGVVVPGVLLSAAEHGLAVEPVDLQTMREIYAGFELPEDSVAVFEAAAGYLLVEQCVLAYLTQAEQSGATLVTGEEVREWSVSSGVVTVRTDKNTYQAARLIVTAGAWAGSLLSDLDIPLEVRRKHLHWYKADSDAYRADLGAPCFFYEQRRFEQTLPNSSSVAGVLHPSSSYFYGFPQLDDRGVKIAEHSGGVCVSDPLQDNRDVDVTDRQRVEQFLKRAMPGVSQRVADHAVCYYTMTADEHFVVDRHPVYPEVSFAAGLSGHGFKFASVLGETLAELAVRGASSLPIAFLSSQRAGLRKD